MPIERYVENGIFDPDKIAAALGTSRGEVAASAGLDEDAFESRERVCSDETQRRLHDFVEVLNKVEPRFSSAFVALAWFRSEPLPGFGNRTAMQLAREGEARQVLEYIDALDAGIHA